MVVPVTPCSRQTVVFFFFQAEDGIRDLTVTGVQTCALPISTSHQVTLISESIHESTVRIKAPIAAAEIRGNCRTSLQMQVELGDTRYPYYEIGRASCRERV